MTDPAAVRDPGARALDRDRARPARAADRDVRRPPPLATRRSNRIARMTDATAEAAETPTRTFETIGIVGLGTMGAGIAEVFAREGYKVDRRGPERRGPRPRRQHLEHSTGRAVARQKMTEEEQAELLGRITFTHRAQGPHRRRLRRRGRRRVGRGQEADLPRARLDRGPRGDPGDQHLVAVGHRHLDRQRPARAGSSASTSSTPRPCRAWSRSSAPSSPRSRSSPTSPRWSARSARTRSSAATRPASSPTPCCSATSTTRSRCTRASTPPARTSTPPCGSAAATRWARCSCST